MGCPRVSIIVLNFNGGEYLKNCFGSLESQTYPNYEVIMVDNASTDVSVEYVKRNFLWVRVIRNEKNLGFAEGNNVGAKYTNGDYIVFLNNDAEVDSNWLEELVKIANSDKSIGICGCKVLDFDQRNVICDVGSTLDVFGFPYNRTWYEKDKHRYDFVTDVLVVPGVAFLVKREIWARIDGFDSAYFAYIEELDLCWRALLLGYRVVVNPFSVAYHRKVGMTTGKMPYSRRKYFSERNTLRMILKNYSEPTLFKVLPGYFALIFSEFLFFMFRGNTRVALANIQAILWNIRNFKGTWHLHKKIQRMRLVNDDVIQTKMARKSVKILIFKSQSLRRIVKG